MQKKIIEATVDQISKKYTKIDKDKTVKIIEGVTDIYKTFKKDNNKESSSSTRNEQTNYERTESTSKTGNNGQCYVVEETTYKSNRNSLLINKEEDPYTTADEDDEKQELIPSNYSKTSEESPTENYITTDDDEKPPPIGWVPPPPLPPEIDPQPKVDISQFLQKKSLAQGMMDLALVSANTNQLRTVLDQQATHPYFATSLSLIIGSLILQVIVGLSLIWNSRYNVRKKKEMASADRINNLSVIGIFLITLINVFISTFGNNGSSVDKNVSTSADIADEGA